MNDGLRVVGGRKGKIELIDHETKRVYPVASSDGRKWYDMTAHRGKFKYLGVFDNDVEAALVWNTEAFRLRGEFAVLNDVSGGR